MKSSRSINGVPYSRSSCHSTKTAANKKAKSVRKAGWKARVFSNKAKTRFCVFQGTKMQKRRSSR